MSSTTQLSTPTVEAPGVRETPAQAPAGPGAAWKVAGVALALLPALLTAYLAFRTGGYYAEAYAGVVALLALALGCGVFVSRRPFAGFSTPLMVAGGALALLVIWTWLSAGWSDAPARALFESQRTALYLLALVFFGAFLRRRGGVRLATIGLAVAILVVCITSLATRLYPDEFTIASTLADDRMSFPFTYWNTLGLFAGIGLVLLLHLSSDLREHPVVRSVAAAGVPVTALTLYFTFSRGATGAVAVGVVAYLLAGRSRGLAGALLATALPTFLLLREAYSADLLGTAQYTSAAGAQQGHDVAGALLIACIVTAVIRAALVPLDGRLERVPPAGRRIRRAALIGALGAVLVGGVLAIALDAPGRIESGYDSFTQSEQEGDARTRLRDVTLSERDQQWEVALEYFREDRLKGEGAGTYETQWLRSREGPGETDQAHSLYIELLGELGLVGVLLMATALIAILGSLLMRARGERRPLYGALFAATLAWAVHAGVDWDWELPAAGIGLFAVAGIALARTTPADGPASRVSTHWAFRIAVAFACVLLGMTAIRTVIADAALDDATRAADAGDCRTATADARSALSAVSNHPKAHEIIGWCHLEAGRETDAIRAMREAASLDPTQWRYRYGLAIARGSGDIDPRPDLRRALALNPRGEIFASGSVAQLFTAGPARWERLAEGATQPSY